MNKILTFLFLLTFISGQSQQLNCTVTVNSATITNGNPQVFKALENSISEFVNRTDWTGEPTRQHERINCSMYITLNSWSDEQYSATLQVQSARPVYGSTYTSPILNFMDKDFAFRYVQFERMNFNPTSFDSNLISVLAFYSYMILGMDGDTFSPGGGNSWLEVAREVATVAQQSGYKGWSQADGNQNRFFLVNDMLSPTFSAFRNTQYMYHFEGLDMMSRDPKKAKQQIVESLEVLSELYSVRPNSFLNRIFFDAKSDEIVSIFSGGPSIPITGVVNNLNKVSPLNSSKWSKIKF
jgi:hypothetical protein